MLLVPAFRVVFYCQLLKKSYDMKKEDYKKFAELLESESQEICDCITSGNYTFLGSINEYEYYFIGGEFYECDTECNEWISDEQGDVSYNIYENCSADTIQECEVYEYVLKMQLKYLKLKKEWLETH